MKKALVALVCATLMMAIGTANASKKPLKMWGQKITSHQVVRDLPGNRALVKFMTKRRVPKGGLWAAMPKQVLTGELKTVSVHWYGDDSRRRFDGRPDLWVGRGERVEGDNPTITPYRPHGPEKKNRRSKKEITAHMALMEYIHKTWGVREVCLGGHSGGALVAMALAHELPHRLTNLRIRAVRLASTKLAVKNHYRRHEGGLPRDGRAYQQYDPIDHISKMSPKIPTLMVHDPSDPVAVMAGGMMPYLKKAWAMGMDMKLVKVSAFPPHSTEWALGQELRKSGNEKYRCF